MLTATPCDVAAFDLPEPQQSVLRYAYQLTVDPASISPADAQQLRDVGLDDLAIHDVCSVTAYFAFVNRIADGLGVQLEAEQD